MPVVVAQLASGLANVFRGQPGNGALAAMLIAGEYDAYCQAAMAPPGLPILTGAGKSALQGILTGALASSSGAAANVAQAFSTGIMAYWMSPPVMFVGGPASGVVTAMPGAPAVIGPITAALSNTMNSEDTIGQLIAAALDTATKTVLVTYATPPPPALPPPATVI